MSQFPKEYLEELLDGLKDDGIVTSYCKMLVSALKPAQVELDQKKIKKMVGKMSEKMESGDFSIKPLLVSRDNYILDGHHRRAARLSYHPEVRLSVIKIDMNFKDLLKYSDKFSGPKKTVDGDKK